MIDIHCHILFGVDDGAASVEDAVEMAVLAASGGTRAIFATPHCNIPDSYENYWDEDLVDRFNLVQEAIDDSGCDLLLYPGQEVFVTPDTIRLLEDEHIITLNFSRYLLCEFDFEEYDEVAFRRLEEIVANGYVPIVAHPERYGFVREDEDAAMQLKSIGCLLQINKGSLSGMFGEDVRQVAHSLLEAEVADFVAGDAHSQFMRTPFLADAHEMISELYSPDYADMLLSVNPLRVINNDEIETW